MRATCFTIMLMISFFTMAAMEQKLLVTFPAFNNLEPELQVVIFQMYDYCYSGNRNTLQQINRFWHQEWSIARQGVFTEDFCKNHTNQMAQILLRAAYFQHYGAVENILKNSSYLAYEKEKTPYIKLHFFDGSYTIDRQSVVQHHAKTKIRKLFNEYDIKCCEPPAPLVKNMPSQLLLACYYNNEEMIEWSSDANDRKRALDLAIEYDYQDCVNKIINTLYDYNVTDIYINPAFEDFLIFDLFTRVCEQKKMRTLELFLQNHYFNINHNLVDKNQRTVVPMINNDIPMMPIALVGCTILDDMLKKVKEDESYSAVVKLLKKYDAKTMKELEGETCIIC